MPINLLPMLEDFLRVLARQWKLVVALALLAACLFLQHTIDGLRADIALQKDQLLAKQGRLDAAEIYTTVLEASIDAAVQEQEARARAAAAAMAEARRQSQRQDREIAKLRAFTPATGDDCKDALMRLNDYRSRQP